MEYLSVEVIKDTMEDDSIDKSEGDERMGMSSVRL